MLCILAFLGLIPFPLSYITNLPGKKVTRDFVEMFLSSISSSVNLLRAIDSWTVLLQVFASEKMVMVETANIAWTHTARTHFCKTLCLLEVRSAENSLKLCTVIFCVIHSISIPNQYKTFSVNLLKIHRHFLPFIFRYLVSLSTEGLCTALWSAEVLSSISTPPLRTVMRLLQ